jgi:hypothetical protein
VGHPYAAGVLPSFPPPARPSGAHPDGPHPLAELVGLEGVGEAVAEAREACEQLRWHRALRRQWGVARTESGIRCARAGLGLEGVRMPVALVRDVARGAADAPSGPEGLVLLGALRVQAQVQEWMPAPGAAGTGMRTPAAQLLARLHTAAVGAAPGTGRPRSPFGAKTAREVAGGQATSAWDGSGELRGLGPAPSGPELAARLRMVGELLDRPRDAAVPAVVLAAVVLGELLVLRPFEGGNAAVARGVFRHLLTREAVDPVGVVVPEVRWAGEPLLQVSTVARFATGEAEGVAGWLRYCAQAVVHGAQEGTRVADAVLAGRLGD